MESPASVLTGMVEGIARVAAMPMVYSGYLATTIKKSVLGGDKESVFRSVGPIEPLGDCRYAMVLTDFNGTEYRVTVEVADRKAVAE